MVLDGIRWPAVPRLDDGWIRTPIDAFVLAKLREKGLHPSPEADRRTLIRRLTYDLHGLPPTPEEVDAFIADTPPTPTSSWSTGCSRRRAMASDGDATGWTRRIMANRTATTKTSRAAMPGPIATTSSSRSTTTSPTRSLSQEQLAGDVLFPDDPNATIALGFIAAGPVGFRGACRTAGRHHRQRDHARSGSRRYGGGDHVVARQHDRALCALPRSQVRSHPQDDYYSLQAVFAGVDRADRPFDRDPEVFRRRNSLMAKKRASWRSAAAA